ncbi:MAG: PKD domain-containing protein [bacterium]|nr:PKD domain-containing protein [bacterium]
MLRNTLLAGLSLAAVAAAQTPINLPTFTSTFTSTLTRGFWFQAPVNCIITGLECPNEAANPNQCVEVFDLGLTAPPAFPTTTTGTQLFYDNATPAGTKIATNIVLTAGNYYGILGASNPSLGSATSANSYGAGPFTSDILGNPTVLTRFITQFGIAAGGNNPVSSGGGSIARVFTDIVPAVGLFPAFTADVTSGNAPLTVNFTDTSFANPGPITSWAWDFENDGTIDSTLQNPSHTYTACGTYDVALTVDDGNGPQTVVETGLITTDAVDASFTAGVIAPLVVQFTDTSTGPVASWDWDLDGDGTTDSTVQNPAFAYPSAGAYNVTLTIGNSCAGTSSVTEVVRSDLCLSTTFADNNGLSAAGPTMFFDMSVLNATGIEITGLEVNTSAAVSSPVTIDVYACSTVALGNESNPDAWTMLGTATGTAAGRGVPTPVAFAAPAFIAKGDYGVAVHYRDVGVAYTNGNGTNQAYANADLSLSLGFSRTSTPNAPFTSGSNITPRVWNGTVCYDTCSFSGTAGYGYAGAGCPGSLGQSTLTPSGDPVIGTTLDVTVDNLPANAAIMIVGLDNDTWTGGPLPLDGGPFGAPGCFLRVSDDLNTVLIGAGGSATWSLPIPNDPSFVCLSFYQQAIVVDPGFNPAGATASNAGAATIGN